MQTLLHCQREQDSPAALQRTSSSFLLSCKTRHLSIHVQLQILHLYGCSFHNLSKLEIVPCPTVCYLLSQLYPQVSCLDTGWRGWVLCPHMLIAHLGIFLGSQEEHQRTLHQSLPEPVNSGLDGPFPVLGNTDQTKPAK